MFARMMAVVGAMAVGACGASGALGISADDNDPAALRSALAVASKPATGRPVNALGKPLALLVARDKQRSLIAYDLEAKRELWRVPAEVTSRVLVGRDFVAHLEGKTKMVARDIKTGRALWSHDLEGEFIGAATDEQAVYVTTKQSSSRWVLTAIAGDSGHEQWQVPANGSLGAPAARAGLVFSPFLKQWLAVIDARTGKQLTRIRGTEEEITFVHAASDNVFFGSKAGVFLLDERAASGKRSQSTYGKATLPTEFIRVHYDWDAFDPVQGGYSAYDRNRILWRAAPQGDALAFSGDRVVVHHFRFFFGFDATSGNLAWAYSHPRVDVVGSAHLGSAIAFASLLGNLGALDPATGRRIYKADVAGQLLGVTFDAEGWVPSEADAGGDETGGTAGALAAIAQDRDARFADVKKFAVTALSKLPGADVTRDLIGLIQNDQTPAFLRETAVEVLIARKDPAGLPHLAQALAQRHDFIADTRPRAIGVVAEAIAGLRGKELDSTAQAAAVVGLLSHMAAPETSVDDLASIIRALGAIGGGAETASLRSFLLTYRTDPAFSTQIGPLSAAIDVLLQDGRASEIELVAYIARDARTQAAVAEYASQALSRMEAKKPDVQASGDAAAPAK